MCTVSKISGMMVAAALVVLGVGCTPAESDSTSTIDQDPMPPVREIDPPTNGGPITDYDPGISDPGQNY